MPTFLLNVSALVLVFIYKICTLAVMLLTSDWDCATKGLTSKGLCDILASRQRTARQKASMGATKSPRLS